MKIKFSLIVLGAVILCNLGQVSQAGELLIITHKNNPAEKISLSDLKQIFKLDRKFWPNGDKVTVVLNSANLPETERFNKAVYNMNAIELKKFMFAKVFSGKVSNPPKTFASYAEMVKFVSLTPGAVAYSDKENLNPGVKVLKLDNGSL